MSRVCRAFTSSGSEVASIPGGLGGYGFDQINGALNGYGSQVQGLDGQQQGAQSQGRGQQVQGLVGQQQHGGIGSGSQRQDAYCKYRYVHRLIKVIKFYHFHSATSNKTLSRLLTLQ